MAPRKEAFKLKGVEYNIPKHWKEKILDLSDIVGIYEPYPAHMSGRHIPKDEISLTKTGRNLVVVKEEHAKLPNLVPLPPFLRYLEDYIKAELIRRKCPDKGPDLKRLKIYQEVFNFIIMAFRIYGPLLNDIKKQYDRKLAYYESKIAEFAPYNRQLFEYSSVIDEDVAHFANLDCREKKGLLRQKITIHDKIENLSHKQSALRYKIHKSKCDLSQLHVKYLDEFDSRKLLSQDADNRRSQIEDLQAIKEAHKAFDEIKIHPENLKLFIRVAKEAHQEVQDKLNELQETYKNVIPAADYHNMQDSIASLEVDIMRMKEENEFLAEELKDVKTKIGVIVPQRDYLYLQFEKWKDQTVAKVNYEFIIRCLQGIARQKLNKAVSVLATATREMNRTLVSSLESFHESSQENVFPIKIGKGNKSLHEILGEIESILEFPPGFIMEFRDQIPKLLSINLSASGLSSSKSADNESPGE